MSHSDSDNHGLFLPSKASKERWDCVQFWNFFLSFSFFLPKKFCEAANAYYLSRLICAESEISKLVRFLIIGFHRWLLRWREASHRFSLIMKGFSNIPHYYSFWCHFVSDFIILYCRKRWKGIFEFQLNSTAWLLPPEERCLWLPNYLNIWYALIN